MIYILVFFGLLLLATIYIKLALRFNIFDIPNTRSSHSNLTVRGGGIIFPISLLIWFIYSGFQYPWFIVGLIIISIVSFWDDLSSISSRLRLPVHIIALLFLFIQIQLFKLPWIYLLPILVISAGIINAYNFMDGINGITGGYSLSVIFAIWIVNNYQFKFVSNEFIYFIFIALLVFNYLNFRANAKCFAGDIGSISIGYIIVFLLTKLIIESGNLLYVLFLSIYGTDTIFTIIYRITKKENIFVAHRKHLYQLLVNELKISHLKVAGIYAMLQLLICLVVFIVSDKHLSLMNGLITGTIIVTIISAFYYFIRIQISEKAVKF